MMCGSVHITLVAALLVGMLVMSTVSAPAIVPEENDNASCVGWVTSFFAVVLGMEEEENFGRTALPFFKEIAEEEGISPFGRAVRGAARNKPDLAADEDACPFPVD